VSGARTQACFRELRSLRAKLEEQNPQLPTLSRYPLRIVSENNFPTAAGLASSAAGFAALVRAIADLYQLKESPTDLSRIARQGSGSACRSLFGGYVAWEMGLETSGADSEAVQIAPYEHWPEMQALILVVSAAKKGVSSTTGMQATVATSSLYPARVASVPQRMSEMVTAIKERNFETFGRLTMKDSNSFHATCLDTEPPIFYLNDISRAAIRVVEGINAQAGKIIAAYTFDAGPNAVIYFEEKNASAVAGVFKARLTHLGGWENIIPSTIESVDEKALATLNEGVSRVILTRVGCGPISTQESLVDERGEPAAKS
jgi:diphosphomevalonate decarboxylase